MKEALYWTGTVALAAMTVYFVVRTVMLFRLIRQIPDL